MTDHTQHKRLLVIIDPYLVIGETRSINYARNIIGISNNPDFPKTLIYSNISANPVSCKNYEIRPVFEIMESEKENYCESERFRDIFFSVYREVKSISQDYNVISFLFYRSSVKSISNICKVISNFRSNSVSYHFGLEKLDEDVMSGKVSENRAASITRDLKIFDESDNICVFSHFDSVIGNYDIFLSHRKLRKMCKPIMKCANEVKLPSEVDGLGYNIIIHVNSSGESRCISFAKGINRILSDISSRLDFVITDMKKELVSSAYSFALDEIGEGNNNNPKLTRLGDYSGECYLKASVIVYSDSDCTASASAYEEICAYSLAGKLVICPENDITKDIAKTFPLVRTFRNLKDIELILREVVGQNSSTVSDKANACLQHFNAFEFVGRLFNRYKKVVFSINQDLKDSFGHYMHYDTKIAEHMPKDVKLCILANKKYNGCMGGNIYVRKTFSHNSWVNGRHKRNLQIFRNELTSALEEIRQIYYSAEKIIVYLYCGSIAHAEVIQGIIREYRHITFHINLFYEHFLIFKNIQNKEKINKSLAEMYKEENLYLYIDSVELYKIFSKDLLIKPIYWPMFPITNFNCCRQINSKKPLVVFPGIPRPNKGYKLSVNLANMIVSDDRYSAVIRTNNETLTAEDLAEVQALEKKLSEKIITLAGILSEEDYGGMYQSASLVFIPYQFTEFKTRTSSALLDAIVNKKPIIAISGTWLSAIIEKFGIGESVVYDVSKEGLDKAFKTVCNVLDNLEIYETNYEIYGSEIDRLFSIDKLIDLLLCKENIKIKLGEITDRVNGLERLLNRRIVKKDMSISSSKKDITENRGKRFLVMPKLSEVEELSSIVNKLAFALPDSDIDVLVKASITKDSLKVPTEQRSYFHTSGKINLVTSYDKEDYTDYLIADMKQCNSFYQKNKAQCHIIDPMFRGVVESGKLKMIGYHAISEDFKAELRKKSYNNFMQLLNKYKDKRSAYCFVTGPSFKNYKYLDKDESRVNVVCNSIVKNDAILEHIGGPDIVTFADPAFHFSTCEYSAVFRDDVIKVVKHYGSYIIVPEPTLPILIYHYPELRDNLIGMPVSPDKTINFVVPSSDKFFVKSTDNILTLFMLPIASALAKKVYIIGADGRQKSETYFWQHNSDVQYHDLMDTVYKTHPSFFRDRDYEDYYDDHCEVLRKQLEYGEKAHGNIYRSITYSYIPSLASRFEGWLYESKLQKLSLSLDETIKTLQNKFDKKLCISEDVDVIGTKVEVCFITKPSDVSELVIQIDKLESMGLTNVVAVSLGKSLHLLATRSLAEIKYFMDTIDEVKYECR